MKLRVFCPLLLLCAIPLAGAGAERACDQSEPLVMPSPQGSREASIQHQVCESASGRAAAAITVFVGDRGAALSGGGRVLATAVPRTHAEWPRVVWRSETAVEVWVPNFAQVLETKSQHGDVAVTLRYCKDDPAARERVARHESDLQAWMAAVSRWNEARKQDAAAAGSRPPRPEEPRRPDSTCSDADLLPRS